MERPKHNTQDFEIAINNSELTELELDLVEHIRYTGIFDELSLRKSLSLPTKPPALYRLNKICEKIAIQIPEIAKQFFEWSAQENPDKIAWKGNLICSIGYSCDGVRLEPESGTVLYHTFIVHKELFNGLGSPA